MIITVTPRPTLIPGNALVLLQEASYRLPF